MVSRVGTGNEGEAAAVGSARRWLGRCRHAEKVGSICLVSLCKPERRAQPSSLVVSLCLALTLMTARTAAGIGDSPHTSPSSPAPWTEDPLREMAS